MKNYFFNCLCCLITFAAFSQDIITTKSGEDIKAKVIEVNTTDIKYKKTENIDGPVFSVLKSEILIIRYENGTKDIFNSVKPVAETNIDMPDKEAFAKGKVDAKKFYKGRNSGGVGTACASIFASPILGLIPAIACSSASPNSDNLNYPNYELMKNSEYNLSYKTEAHSIKKKKVWGGYALGSSLWLGIVYNIIRQRQ